MAGRFHLSIESKGLPASMLSTCTSRSYGVVLQKSSIYAKIRASVVRSS